MPLKALCIVLLLLLRYQLWMQPVMVCSRLQSPDERVLRHCSAYRKLGRPYLFQADGITLSRTLKTP